MNELKITREEAIALISHIKTYCELCDKRVDTTAKSILIKINKTLEKEQQIATT